MGDKTDEAFEKDGHLFQHPFPASRPLPNKNIFTPSPALNLTDIEQS